MTKTCTCPLDPDGVVKQTCPVHGQPYPQRLSYAQALDLIASAPSIDGQRYPLAQFIEEQQREIDHQQAYQRQMNEILKENARLRNDLTAVGLERDRLQKREILVSVALRNVLEVVQKDSPQWFLAEQLLGMMGGPAHEPVSAHKVQCGCGWVGMTTELVRLDGKHECPACSAEFKALNAWPPLKSEVRHCTNYLTYPGGQSCCTREAGHSGSCLF